MTDDIWSQTIGLEGLEKLASYLSNKPRDMNEADTRHQILDILVHDLLAWPRNRVGVETKVNSGYVDYVLKRHNGEPALLIEAKREGKYFDLPIAKKDENWSYIGLDKLMSDANVKAAINQVRSYSLDIGSEYAAISNGHEWVIFKTFDKGKKWDSLHAFVIRSISFFQDDYTKAYNALSFVAVNDNFSLVSLLTSSAVKDRAIYYPKDGIAAYSHQITANRLAGALRPIVTRYFGVISDDDTDFMDKCYVAEREYRPAFASMRDLLEDSISPYFRSYGVKQLEETGKGGQLGGRLTKNIRLSRKGEVLVLFGGKGAGKSTFLKRLLHHNPPKWLRENSIIALIDLLKTPESTGLIRDAIWEGLVSSLDPEGLLASDRAILLRDIFADRFDLAGKQQLSGLAKTSEAYNLKLNDLVSVWLADKRYCAQRLVEYWRTRGRGLIVIIDNTDQYSGTNQDFCFTSAQEISDQFGCISVISMREERFYNSKIHGVLDAFQNAGFHISSPRPAAVFRKRLEYTISQLAESGVFTQDNGAEDVKTARDAQAYLRILSREFGGVRSPLSSFLTACAQGDIRLSLDLFRSFLLSGYTNVEEMLAEGSWNFQLHQVIKPVMIPTRYFYDETISDIPNVFQVRYNRNGSHFTALRILRKLAKNVETSTPTYMAVAELKSYFVNTFNMLDDLERNLDVLLKHGFVEANNRIDKYEENVDSVKITNYGIYMLSELSHQFSYVDLICTDCGIFSEQISSYLTEAARKEYGLFTSNQRVERVQVRLERVNEFLGYLKSEEFREREVFSLGMPEDEMFTHRLQSTFEAESARVLASARKQVTRRALRRKRTRPQTP